MDALHLMMYRSACVQPLSLRRILSAASFIGCADIAVTDVQEQSSRCRAGSLFAALPGTKSHGRDFVVDAVRHGAAALLAERPLCSAGLPQCIVPSARRAYAEICQALAGYPARKLGTIGVTGTNGKTTTTWMLQSILEAAGRPAGVLGTIHYSDGIQSTPSALTTPDAQTLAHWLCRMVANGTRYAAMELSSHALDQCRAGGVSLDIAVVTNITQDHFDYHGTFDAYRAAKARILDLVKRGGLVILNNDDPGSRSLWEQAGGQHRTVTVGFETEADIEARIVREQPSGTEFRVRLAAGESLFRLGMAGRHNVSNALGAIAACDHLGLSVDEIQRGLDSMSGVPGRLERVDCGQAFNVFVDYAHTDDALRHVIGTVRQVTSGRVIVLFGAGGDRDRTKRPRMAHAAATADSVIVTSDNPRREAPERILDEIVAGFGEADPTPLVIVDREEAIERALEIAEPGDSVILAGKGHEKFQIVGEERLPFDDVAICRQRLRRLAQQDRIPA